MKRKGSNGAVEGTLIALSAAGIGVGLMYLMDPEQGRRRRAAILAQAEHALAHASEVAGSTLHSAKGSARTAAEKVSGYAQHLAENLSDTAHDAIHSADQTARNYASQAQEKAESVHHHLLNRAQEIVSRARKSAGLKEESHPVALTAGITGATVGVLGLGAGLMYVLDPAKGRARRAWIRDKAFSFTLRSGRTARQYGRHLGNRMRGVVAETRSSMPFAPPAKTW